MSDVHLSGHLGGPPGSVPPAPAEPGEADPDLVGEQGPDLTVDVSRVERPEVHEEFRGPALAFTLSAAPVIDTVDVEGPNGPTDVDVDGRTVTRTAGHFGRGRWTVTYQPA